MKSVTLSMTERQHQDLRAHLFPGDGLEAVSLLLCGRRAGERDRLSVRELLHIPHDECRRAEDRVTWPTARLLEVLVRAGQRGWSVMKIHSHASLKDFSKLDDASDRELFPSLHAWLEDGQPLGSLVMLENGEIFGRTCSENGGFSPLASVAVIGDDITIWRDDISNTEVPAFGERVAQTFGRGTFAHLQNLKVGVVGVSGTGSPVIEMLARNCVGTLVLVDPDRVEERNLNRILNATRADARSGTPKVEVLRRAVRGMGLGTKVEVHVSTLFDRNVVKALADCDVLFGCMDSVDGRHLLNRLASFYCIPYLDLGVRLDADGEGGVEQVCGSVHYLKPGGSSLLSRHVYSSEQLRAAGLLRTDPATYRNLLAEGYIKGVAEDRPAVIQLNMLIASLAVNELLARLHPYRIDPNGEFAVRRISLSHGIFESESDGEPCPSLAKQVGRGDVEPLLEWAELSLKVA